LAFFSSTLDGLTTLRAFNMQSHFMNAFMKKLDYNNRAWYSYLYLSRWIGFRLDFVSSLMVLTATLGAVGVKSTSNSGLIAFALFYVLRLTSLFQWAVRQSAEAENFMTSLERIYTYSTLPDEGIRIQNSNRPSKDWPSRGEIKVIDLKLRYRSDLDLVLNGLNLNILPSEKIGVCGRTGAGKSSLFSAFFRLVNAESGSIEIDGIDISTIGLDDLRAKLSIIPQDPVIFSGTIRYNLDPFSLYSDDAIWDALEAVQMKSVVEKLPEGLQTKIAEYGGNFSVGEGQLICVARAILKPSKILFVDEATANVDKRTDELIQNVLRTKFKDRTLITIAHRLNTIIDYDRIVVMNEGKVAEFGKPLELLSIPNGIFKSMASESGIHGI
jgi:ABC-type multidrug transport system fused ATPase/permease subunit